MNASKKGFSCIAVDMGAGSIRVMLCSIGGDKIHLEEAHRIENKIQLQDGRDTWDMDRIVQEIQTGI